MIRASLFCGIAGLFVGMPVFADPSYSFQSVVNAGDPAFTQLLGINNAGTIAGYFGDGSVVPKTWASPLVLPNNFTNENYPGSTQTQVVGINNTGETVGFWMDSGGIIHGFTDIGGSFTTVSNPSTTTVTQLLGVNGRRGWLQPDQLDDLGRLPGRWRYLYCTRPFGSTFAQPLGLNDSGQIVGDYIDAGGQMHGFVYTISTGIYQSVDDPNGIGTTTINGINDQGQLVGFYVDSNQNTIGFVASASPEPNSLSLTLLGAMLAGVALKLRSRRA